jgi:hypothetical protein
MKEVVQTFQINFKTMEEAVKGVIGFFGMHVCDGTDAVSPGEKMHPISLSGKFYDSQVVSSEFNKKVLVRGQIGFNSQYGCVLKTAIRSMSELVSTTLLECII